MIIIEAVESIEKARDSGKEFSRKKSEAGKKERLKETHC